MQKQEADALPTLFSMRHRQSLKNDTLRLSIPRVVRYSLSRVCGRHDESWHFHEDGYHGSRAHSDDAEAIVLTCTGRPAIQAIDDNGQWAEADFFAVIERGNPDAALDLVEAFLHVLPQDDRAECHAELNNVLRAHLFPWQLVDNRFQKIESAYFQEEVLAPACMLLTAGDFPGPQQELLEAQNELSAGDGAQAIQLAHRALESTMKCVLGVDRQKPGELLRNLIDSELIEDYHTGFLKALEQLIYGLTKERSEPGRAHGQGKDIVEVPNSLAALVVHLCASIMLFIMQHWADKRNLQSAEAAPADPFVNQDAGDDAPDPFGDEEDDDPFGDH